MSLKEKRLKRGARGYRDGTKVLQLQAKDDRKLPEAGRGKEVLLETSDAVPADTLILDWTSDPREDKSLFI